MGDTQTGHVGLRALPGPGTDIGAYRILDLLGTGGMGQVFLAEHRKLGRRVALKLLLPEFAGNRDVIGRFFHEARAVNQINHQHIVEIVDFVEEPGGFNYFIMELLDGRDLAQSREREGPFALERIVFILRQMLSALSATHAKGIVHRDLKPENIFLVSRDGNPDFVKLLDFGIAKLSAQDLGDARPRTRAGMILGTPEYMSPEQAGGQVIDYRSDIYAVGVILYWMLSDRLPYNGRSVGELLVKQLTSPPQSLPDVSTSGEVIPSELAALTYRSLSRDPKRRPTADELLESLNLIEIRPILMQRPKRRLVWPAVATGILLLAIAGYGVFRYGKPSPVAAVEAVAPPAQSPILPAQRPPAAPAQPVLAPAALAAPSALPATPQADDPKPPSAAAENRQKPVPARHAKVKSKPREAPASDDSSGMLDPFANP